MCTTTAIGHLLSRSDHSEKWIHVLHEKSILNFVQDSGIPGILYFCYSERIRSEEVIRSLGDIFHRTERVVMNMYCIHDRE